MDTHSRNDTLAHFGTWVAFGAAATTALSFGIAIATPPLSGAFCLQNCIPYPYLTIADRFPRDYYWMFPAIVATLLYVALMVALHIRTAPGRQVYSLLALVLASMAALVLVGDYVVQLAVVQPSILAGEADGISLLTQYNPHGLFIALEELGYLLMSLSLACAAPALAGASRLERVLRWLLVGGLVVSLALLAGILLAYGHTRGYLFEIAIISVDWLVLIVASVLLGIIFRRDAAGVRA